MNQKYQIKNIVKYRTIIFSKPPYEKREDAEYIKTENGIMEVYTGEIIGIQKINEFYSKDNYYSERYLYTVSHPSTSNNTYLVWEDEIIS